MVEIITQDLPRDVNLQCNEYEASTETRHLSNLRLLSHYHYSTFSHSSLSHTEHTPHAGAASWQVTRVVRTDLQEQINGLEQRLMEEEESRREMREDLEQKLKEEQEKRTEVESKLGQRLKEEEESRVEMRKKLEQKLKEEQEKRTEVESKLEQKLKEEEKKRMEREQEMEQEMSGKLCMYIKVRGHYIICRFCLYCRHLFKMYLYSFVLTQYNKYIAMNI